MRLLLVTALAAAALLTACGSDKKTSTPTSGASPSPKAVATVLSATAAASPTAQTQPGGTKTYKSEPPMTIDVNKMYFATIKMDIGDIRIELYPKDAPHTVNSFVFLARDGFYDGITFHRVISGFVAQAGDPTGTGRGGPGYTIPDEVNSHKFLDGSVGMAKTSAPSSGGSQFFIDLAPQDSLNGGYTVFGQVVAGRDIADKIAVRDPASATTPGTKINTIVIEEQ